MFYNQVENSAGGVSSPTSFARLRGFAGVSRSSWTATRRTAGPTDANRLSADAILRQFFIQERR